MDHSMKIRSLAGVPITDLVDCFLRSFEGYFVPLPTEMSYWQRRFADAGADYDLSFGVFDGEQLVGFVIHCIGEEAGRTVAYNTGTGVLPGYRGQQWVDEMVRVAIPILRDAQVATYRLEVIDQNVRAIRVYERIGLQIKRRLKCYHGPLPEKMPSDIVLEERPVTWCIDPSRSVGPYAWDMSNHAIRRAVDRYHGYVVYRKGSASSVGHFVIELERAHVVQLEAPTSDWAGLFAGIRQLVPSVKINNIDAGRTDLLQWLDQAKVANVIDQYEMEMALS
ncbi:MAG: GNAT family N-acetyltransferase [Saprospiraceae bacterium]